MSVDVRARHAEEEGARRDLARVERDVGEGDARVAADRRSGTAATRSRERRTGGKAGATASELTRAPGRGSVAVMAVRDVGRRRDRRCGAGSPRRWIAYRAISWNSGAAATPP